METRLFLTLWWLTACRPTNLRQIQARNIHIDWTAKPHPRMQITFTQHKTIAHLQPYTIHTTPCFREVLDTIPTHAGLVFSDDKVIARAVSTMKKVNEHLCARSTRRGALQQLASNPDNDAKLLMTFSRHSDEKTLMRYLNWGQEFSEAQVQGARAAAMALLPAGLNVDEIDWFGTRR